jgi:hypothetical protein
VLGFWFEFGFGFEFGYLGTDPADGVGKGFDVSLQRREVDGAEVFGFERNKEPIRDKKNQSEIIKR